MVAEWRTGFSDILDPCLIRHLQVPSRSHPASLPNTWDTSLCASYCVHFVYSQPPRLSTSAACHSTRPLDPLVPIVLILITLCILSCSNADGLAIAKRSSNLIVHRIRAHAYTSTTISTSISTGARSQWPSCRVYLQHPGQPDSSNSVPGAVE